MVLVSNFGFRASCFDRAGKLGAGIDFEERLVEFDRFAIVAEDGDDFAADFGRDFVENLHRLDDADRRRRIDAVPDLDIRFGLRIRPAVERADHRALDEGDVGGLSVSGWWLVAAGW